MSASDSPLSRADVNEQVDRLVIDALSYPSGDAVRMCAAGVQWMRDHLKLSTWRDVRVRTINIAMDTLPEIKDTYHDFLDIDCGVNVHAATMLNELANGNDILGPHVFGVAISGVLSVRVLEILVNKCPNLRVLDLAVAPGLTLRAMGLIQRFPRLNDLTLNLFLPIDEKSHSYSIDDLVQVIRADYGSPLCRLRVAFTEGWTKEQLVGLVCLPHLQTLEIHDVQPDRDVTRLMPVGWELESQGQPCAPTANDVDDAELERRIGGSLHVVLRNQRLRRFVPIDPNDESQVVVAV